MDRDNTLNFLNVEEIGKWARFLDTEKTMWERMRIKKRTVVHLGGALAVYIAIMAIFAVIL